MKAFLTALHGLLVAGGTVFLFFDIKIEPRVNNIIIFGSNNTVNPTIDSRSATPLPQPTVQAQVTTPPVEPPKETSAIKEEPAKDNTTLDPDSSVTKAEQSPPSYTKASVAKTKISPKYRAVSASSDSYTNNTDDDYQDADNSDEDSCACPVSRISVRPSTRTTDSNGIDAGNFQRPRPTTYQSSRSEQRQETIINGVRTVRRTVTITNNGETKTYVYDY